MFNGLSFTRRNVIAMSHFLIFDYRGVAQLVARVVWDHEVAGSIPVTSTTRETVVAVKLQRFLVVYILPAMPVVKKALAL